MKTATETTNYEVKNVRTFSNSPAFECTLYKDGKKIGIVSNSGRGGCHDYYIGREEETALMKHAKGIFGDDYIEPDDMFISQLVDKFESDKRFKRISKKKTLFRCKGDAEDSYLTLNAPYSPRVAEYLKKNYGDKIVEVWGHTEEYLEYIKA
jgi:hypothetical protein